MPRSRSTSLLIVLAACAALGACATSNGGPKTSLAPTTAADPVLPQTVPYVPSEGSPEDGDRSLAREVEQAGAKPAAFADPTEASSAVAAVAAVESPEASAVETPVAVAAVKSAAGEPEGAAIPAPKPLVTKPEAGPTTEVASLEPMGGASAERFGRPAEDSAHSRPAPAERVSPNGGVAARSPELDRLMKHYAGYYGVPESLVRRVAKRESTFNPRASNGPYVGLMQISVPTARGMGYRGGREGLLDAETNLKYAVRYLRGAYLVAGGNHDKADKLYQSGYYYHAKRLGLLDETGVGVDRKSRRRSRS